MADENHLEILQQGIKVWNEWRSDNPELKPDLSSADLYRANLSGINLYRANLSSANLRSADLRCANLRNANLRCANLTGADLHSANLSRVDLRSADLRSVNLKDTDLSGAYLFDANLSGGNLRNVILRRANLSRAEFRSAELHGADLRNANLKAVQALKTNFEDVTLTGACIEDWNINSQTNLQNVKCNYVYLKYIYSEEEKKQIKCDRIPHDPNRIFAPGEFTKRYQKILETVELYFGEGIDWQVFLASFQQLQEAEKLKIKDDRDRIFSQVQGIENAGDGSFVIKIGVSPDTDKGEYEKSFRQIYQPMLEAKEEQINFLREEINIKREELVCIRQEKNELLEIIKLRADQQININNYLNNQQGENNMNQQKPGNTYNQSGNFGIGHNEGEIKDNAIVTGVYNEAAQPDLQQAAAEIQQLLEQLSKTSPTETAAEKMVVGAQVVDEISKNPSRWQKPIKVIKAVGIEALAEALDNPIFNIAKAGLEAALEE